MTSLDFGAQTQQTKDQLAVTLAALILHDDKADVTADALSRVLKAANITVAPYWPMLFAKALEGKNVGDYLTVSTGASAQVAGPVATGDAKGPAKEEKKPEPVEEPEVDMDMGDLFG